jgi:hypothetical protein
MRNLGAGHAFLANFTRPAASGPRPKHLISARASGRRPAEGAGVLE